jgi:hypothetical protein
LFEQTLDITSIRRPNRQSAIPNPPSAMSASPASNVPDVSVRIRQKRTIIILATLLIIGGLIIVFALQRMPLPMRILVGLTDIVAGLTLLIVVRQKFSGT